MLVYEGMNQIVVTVGPGHPLREAARRMDAHNVIVLGDHGDPVGIISMRDIVRCWVSDGATCEVATGTA